MFIVISREVSVSDNIEKSKLGTAQDGKHLAAGAAARSGRGNVSAQDPVVFSNFAAARRLLRLVTGDAYVDAPDIADRLAEEEELLINSLAKKVGNLKDTVFKLEVLMHRLRNQEYDENYSGWLDLN